MDYPNIKLPSLVRQNLEITTAEQLATKVGSILTRAVPVVDSIKRGLPDFRPRSVLDIGVGLGAKTLLLTRAYPSIRRVLAMDGDGSQPHQGKFKERMQAWSDVMVAYEFLHHNLPGDMELHVYKADPDLIIPDVDLIVSFRAWGHHFGVSTYIELAKRSLGRTGLIILDVRIGTGGKQVLEENGFQFVKVLPDDSTKCQRLVYKRKP